MSGISLSCALLMTRSFASSKIFTSSLTRVLKGGLSWAPCVSRIWRAGLTHYSELSLVHAFPRVEARILRACCTQTEYPSCQSPCYQMVRCSGWAYGYVSMKEEFVLALEEHCQSRSMVGGTWWPRMYCLACFSAQRRRRSPMRW